MTQGTAISVQELQGGFLRSAERFPERPALTVGGREHSYAELHQRAARIAATLRARTPEGGPPLTAIFSYRSVTAYAGVLGTLMSGHGYVPLNRTFPPARTRVMLERAGCRALVVDRESAEQLDDVVGGYGERLLLLLPDEDDVSATAARFPEHLVLGARDLLSADDWEPVPVEPDALAYIIFTSGSTGVPKGVMVAHRNARHYIDAMVERYQPTEEDRCSQMFELTFDVSVFDMFVAWDQGSCLCVPSQKELIKPGKFIRDQELTIWFSAPSTAILMKRFSMTKPDSYPTLRWSMFAGEALPVEVTRSWLEAAPNTIVENLYGPTEVTVVSVLYRWDPESSPAEVELGTVPIGHAVPGLTALVVDSELREVAPGEQGELILAGPQVTLGYWRDAEKTASVFVVPPGRDEVHYRTGDRVRRPAREGGPITYLGRIDHQVKVRGVRIELGEVEAVIREASGVDAVVAIGWPKEATGAGGIEAFIGQPDVDAADVRAACEAKLPTQAVPRGIHTLPELPLNASGKFDRKALVAMLEEKAA